MNYIFVFWRTDLHREDMQLISHDKLASLKAFEIPLKIAVPSVPATATHLTSCRQTKRLFQDKDLLRKYI